MVLGTSTLLLVFELDGRAPRAARRRGGERAAVVGAQPLRPSAVWELLLEMRWAALWEALEPK